MSVSSVRKLAGLFVLLSAVGMAVPGFAQSGGFSGTVTQGKETPCVKCEVTISEEGVHQVYKVKTNKKGEYVYMGLPFGKYTITIFSPNGEKLYSVDKQETKIDTVTVDFDLPKLLAKQKEEQQQLQQKKMKENPEFAKQIEAEKKAQQEAEAKRAKELKDFTDLKSLFEEGKKLYQQKDYKGAVAAFEKAQPLAKTPKNRFSVLMLLANAYQKARELPQAEDAYQKAIQMNPSDASLHNNLGSVYADSKKYNEAEAEYEKAAQLDPAGASRYYFNIGAIMYNAGDMDKALAAFKKVVQADPKNANGYFWEGQALIGKATTGPKGNVIAPPGTAEAYETYLKLDPNGPNAATAKAILQTLKGGVQTQLKQNR